MTAKEKAEELVDKYRTYIRMADKYEYNLSQDEIYLAKHCALIAVDEIIKTFYSPITFGVKDYWQEVKQEIENL
jgi:hypothetical protein